MANTLAFLVVASILFLAVSAGSVNDTECLGKVKDFGKCMAKNHKDKDDGDKIKKVGEKIKKCFDDNKCTEPDYESDPFGNHTGFMKNMSHLLHDAWENTPDKVKDCLKHGFRVFLMKKLNQCLKSQKVDEIKLDDDDVHNMFEHVLKHAKNFTNEQKKGHHDKKEIKAIVNTLVALKQCGKDHGRDAVNGTLQCIDDVKSGVKQDICKAVNDCQKSAVSDDCQKRGKDIQKALCACQLDKLKEVKKKLEKLADGKDHSPADFKGILGDDFEQDKNDTLNGIKKCFTDNKADPPAPIELVLFGALLAGHHEHKGPHTILPMIFAVTAYDTGDKREISDDEIWFLNLVVGNMIQHNECGCD